MTEAREGAGQGWVGLRWAMLTRQQPERTSQCGQREVSTGKLLGGCFCLASFCQLSPCLSAYV